MIGKSDDLTCSPESACRCCQHCEQTKRSEKSCPVSGLPCKAFLTAASPTTLLDVVEAPVPVMCFVGMSQQTHAVRQFHSFVPVVLDPPPGGTALIDLGQLLRV